MKLSLYRFNTFKTLSLPVLAITLGVLAGCNSSTDQVTEEKKPRPVEVMTLVNLGTDSESLVEASSIVAASVASWKTEEIGMEVGGRILRVKEPNTDIVGRIVRDDGSIHTEGTIVAEIDSEKYQILFDNAVSQVERAKEKIVAAKYELEESIEAQIDAAKAEEVLAKTEYDRSVVLYSKEAGAKADVDRDKARWDTATAAIKQLEAQKNAKNAELASLILQQQQEEQSKKDAERSLNNCKLYSSFNGQISAINVVPGSFVNAGEPVATVQLMNPIKVELEVSSEDSRRLRNRQRLPVMIPDASGTLVENDGFLYLIDPVADPQTRTYTITLLVMNKPPDEDSELLQKYATTPQTWRLDLPFIPGIEEGKAYVGKEAILKDAEGHFLWRIDNVSVHESIPKDRLLKVRKMRINPKDNLLPFLGNWIFQEIEVLDPTFDPSQHLVAAQLKIPNDGDPNEWDGDTVLFQNKGQWMLRPGDLVKVNISDTEDLTGIFVPMDAISHEGGKYFLFLIDDSGEGAKVEQVEIKFSASEQSSPTSSMVRIEAADSSVELNGRKYVSRGAHYLRDGEAVKVVQGEDSE